MATGRQAGRYGAREIAENYLDTYAGGRRETGLGWPLEISKPPAHIQQGHTSYSFPNGFTNQGPSMQIFECMGDSLLQTAVPFLGVM